MSTLPLVLFYNRFFDHYPDLDKLPARDRLRFTVDRARCAEADAVIFHIPTFRPSPRLRKYRGQKWVAWSMESKVNYPRLADPDFMRHFDIRMTYERDSDIPDGYLPSVADMEAAVRRPLAAKTEATPVVMFQSDSVDRSGRNALGAALMKTMRVDSYGSFRNNRRIEGPDLGSATKLATIARYKFTLAFENSIAPDYVTEKLFDPLLAGSVPVYLGAPNVADFAPGENCFINAADFDSPQALVAYLTQLSLDEAAYGSYFAWRERPLLSRFRQWSDAQAEPDMCRLAKRLGAPAASGRPRPSFHPFAHPWSPRGLIDRLRGYA